MNKFFIVLPFLSLLFTSCLSVERTVDRIESFHISGMMHRTNVEKGCWQFIGNNSETYELTGMKVTFLLREGLRADLIVRGPLDLSSVCHVGSIVEVIEIIKTYE